MIQVLRSKLPIAVTASSDVEIALHLVEIKAPVKTATVRSTLHLGCLSPLGPLLSHAYNVVHMLLAEAILMLDQVLPASAGHDSALGIPAKLMHALLVDPIAPIRRVPAKLGGGQDAIAGSILHVDMQVGALHLDHHVEVHLHLVRDAFFHGKVAVLLAVPPARRLGPDEDEGENRHRNRPLSATRCPRHILRLCLGFYFVSRDARRRPAGREGIRNASKALTMLPLAPKSSSRRLSFSNPFISQCKSATNDW